MEESVYNRDDPKGRTCHTNHNPTVRVKAAGTECGQTPPTLPEAAVRVKAVGTECRLTPPTQHLYAVEVRQEYHSRRLHSEPTESTKK